MYRLLLPCQLLTGSFFMILLFLDRINLTFVYRKNQRDQGYNLQFWSLVSNTCTFKPKFWNMYMEYCHNLWSKTMKIFKKNELIHWFQEFKNVFYSEMNASFPDTRYLWIFNLILFSPIWCTQSILVGSDI